MCSGDSRGAAPPRTPTRKESRCHQMETISASHLPEFTRVLEFTSQVPGSRISNALAHPLSDSTCTMILRGGVISFTLQPCLSEPGLALQYSCLENPMDRKPGRLQSTGSQRVGHD